MGIEKQQSFDQLPEDLKNKEVSSDHEDAIGLNKIIDYERQNNVDQDTIAKSYLAHVDIYKSLSEDVGKAMDKFYLIEKSNGPDHPTTHEAKLDWDIAHAKVDNERAIMLPMFENLTPETREKYKKDMELHGVFVDIEKK